MERKSFYRSYHTNKKQIMSGGPTNNNIVRIKSCFRSMRYSAVQIYNSWVDHINWNENCFEWS